MHSVHDDLKCNDPRIVKWFNDVYEWHLSEHDLYARAAAPEDAVHG